MGAIAIACRTARPCPATVTPAPITVVADTPPCDPGPPPVEPALAWTVDAGRFVIVRSRMEALQLYLIAVEQWARAVEVCREP